MERIAWSDAEWLNPPPTCVVGARGLTVTAAPGTDFWRSTYYGITRDSGHALLVEFAVGQALEVSFHVALSGPFHQAGLFARDNLNDTWIKAGVELTDDQPHLGVVVANEGSDWSCSPVPSWRHRLVTVRVSRMADSAIVRARVDREPWRLVRLVPLRDSTGMKAGLYCAAPKAPGPAVTFTSMRLGSADASVHF